MTLGKGKLWGKNLQDHRLHTLSVTLTDLCALGHFELFGFAM